MTSSGRSNSHFRQYTPPKDPCHHQSSISVKEEKKKQSGNEYKRK